VLVEDIGQRALRDDSFSHGATGADVTRAHVRVRARQAAFVTDDIEGDLARGSSESCLDYDVARGSTSMPLQPAS
jgi:hypothetical protein